MHSASSLYLTFPQPKPVHAIIAWLQPAGIHSHITNNSRLELAVDEPSCTLTWPFPWNQPAGVHSHKANNSRLKLAVGAEPHFDLGPSHDMSCWSSLTQSYQLSELAASEPHFDLGPFPHSLVGVSTDTGQTTSQLPWGLCWVTAFLALRN